MIKNKNSKQEKEESPLIIIGLILIFTITLVLSFSKNNELERYNRELREEIEIITDLLNICESDSSYFMRHNNESQQCAE